MVENRPRRSHAIMCASIGVSGYPRSANCPHMLCRVGRQVCAGPGRHISGSPYRHALADGALAPCHTKRSTNPSQGQQTACAVALALSDTLPDCVRQPAHSRRRFSMVENRSHRPPAPLSHNQLRSRIRIGNPLFSGCATLATPTSGAFTDVGPHALDPEHECHYAPP